MLPLLQEESAVAGFANVFPPGATRTRTRRCCGRGASCSPARTHRTRRRGRGELLGFAVLRPGGSSGSSAPERLGARCRLAAARRGARARPRRSARQGASCGCSRRTSGRGASTSARLARSTARRAIVPFPPHPLDVGYTARLLDWPDEESPLRAEPDGLAPRRERARRVANRQRSATGCCCGSTTPTPRATSPGGEEAILRDLAWLGVDWDEGPVRQSERLERYREAAATARRPLRRRRRSCARTGRPTYHLASVVDDVDFGITHVIRGNDHRPERGAAPAARTRRSARRRPSTSTTG